MRLCVGDISMPLGRSVEFRAVLQRGNRVQVPKLMRWEIKLESSQTLKIKVSRLNEYDNECFLAE
jgi:hypothetical protein